MSKGLIIYFDSNTYVNIDIKLFIILHFIFIFNIIQYCTSIAGVHDITKYNSF